MLVQFGILASAMMNQKKSNHSYKSPENNFQRSQGAILTPSKKDQAGNTWAQERNVVPLFWKKNVIPSPHTENISWKKNSPPRYCLLCTVSEPVPIPYPLELSTRVYSHKSYSLRIGVELLFPSSNQYMIFIKKLNSRVNFIISPPGIGMAHSFNSSKKKKVLDRRCYFSIPL